MYYQNTLTALSVTSIIVFLVNVWLVIERNNTQGGVLIPHHWTNQYDPSNYPVGGIQARYDHTLVQTGWMEADGSLLRQSAYTHLYSVIGDFYCTADYPCVNDQFRLPNMTARSLSHGRAEAYGGNTQVAMPQVPSHEHKISDIGSFEGQCQMPRHKHSWNTETGAEKETHTHDTTCQASSVGINAGRDAAHNHGAPDIKLGTHTAAHRHRHPCPAFSVPSVAFLHPDKAEPKPYCNPDIGDNCNTCKDSTCPHRAIARYCSWKTEDYSGGRTPQFVDIASDRLRTPMGTMKATPSWNTNHADHPSGDSIERPADGSHVHTFSKWNNLEGGGHSHTIPVSGRPSPFSFDSLHNHGLTSTVLQSKPFDNIHTHADTSFTAKPVGSDILTLSRVEFNLKYYIKVY